MRFFDAGRDNFQAPRNPVLGDEEGQIFVRNAGVAALQSDSLRAVTYDNSQIVAASLAAMPRALNHAEIAAAKKRSEKTRSA